MKFSAPLNIFFREQVMIKARLCFRADSMAGADCYQINA